MTTWWLEGEGGVAARVTPAGLVLGRSPHCDVVLRSDRASRRHALVHLDEEGPRLVRLGRGAVSVDDEIVEAAVSLADGSRVGLPGLELEVSAKEDEPGDAGTVWLLEAPSGALFALTRSPMTVGGGAGDDLRVEGWPRAALRFRADGAGLSVSSDAAFSVDGDEVRPGVARALGVGDRVAREGATIGVVTGGDLGGGSTELSEGGPSTVHLEFLPRGGRLHVTADGRTRTVYLSDRRCDLVAALLSPPVPLAAGELVDDDVVLAQVWGPRHSADRTNLNVLIHRVRKDLDRAGLDGAGTILRAEGGGATRYVLPEGTAVTLE